MLLTSRFAVLPLSYNVLNLSFVCDIFSHKVSGHEVLCKSSLASVSASASCYYYLSNPFDYYYLAAFFSARGLLPVTQFAPLSFMFRQCAVKAKEEYKGQHQKKPRHVFTLLLAATVKINL